MASNLLLLGLFGFISIILDSVLWGVAGYIFYRLMGGKDDKWIFGALALGVVFFVWDSIIANQIFNKVGFSIQDQEVSNFIGDVLGSLDLFDVLISFAFSIVGFKVGQILVNKVINKTRRYKAT